MKNTKNSPSTTPHNNEQPRTVRSRSVSYIPYDPKQPSQNVRSQSVPYDDYNPQQTPYTFRFQPYNTDPKQPQPSQNVRSQSVPYDDFNPQQTPHTFRFQPSNTPYYSAYPQQTLNNAPQQAPHNFRPQSVSNSPYNSAYDYDSTDPSESLLSVQDIFSKMSGKGKSRQPSRRHALPPSLPPSRQSRRLSPDNDGNRSSPDPVGSRERSTNQDPPRNHDGMIYKPFFFCFCCSSNGKSFFFFFLLIKKKKKQDRPHHRYRQEFGRLYTQNQQLYLLLKRLTEDVQEIKTELKRKREEQENELSPQVMDVSEFLSKYIFFLYRIYSL